MTEGKHTFFNKMVAGIKSVDKIHNFTDAGALKLFFYHGADS
jgi:hypothetical protein